MEQSLGEFAWLKNKIAGVESILEIGCRWGDSLKELAAVARPGAKIRAIDHGQPSGECPFPSKDRLRATISELKAKGYDAKALFADSHDPESIEWAKEEGPFDLIFIDADHSYEGAKKDFEQYSPLGKRVALHDISFEGVGMGVKQLWSEIGRTHITQEMTEPGGPGTGIVVMAQ